MTAKSVYKYEHLYGEESTDWDSEYIFSERIQTRSQQFNWQIKSHFHPHLVQLFLLEEGTFTLFSATEKQELTAPCALLIPPLAVHGFEFSSEVQGSILSLSDSVFQIISDKINSHEIEELQIIELTDSAKNSLTTIVTSIDDELINDAPYKKTMIESLLHQLFINLSRLQSSKAVEDNEIQHIITYYRHFQRLIKHPENGLSIITIAQQIGISTVHLNRICNSIAGKPASQLIQDRLLGEAKKYLTYTSYNISEIAYILNFNYPNYFIRFFRKHTGTTPKQFREQHKV